MTILVTNDDGIDAPGIDALCRALSEITTTRVVVVAPKHHQSGCSHHINIRTVIPVEWRSEDKVSVDSTPADCVRLGINYFYDDIDFVISGINAGNNLGSDIYPSGTVAAAREATLHNVPAIALSQFYRKDWNLDWERGIQWAVQVLKQFFAQRPERGQLWNVNFPHLKPDAPEPDIIFCPLCERPLLTEFVKQDNGYLYVGEDINRKAVPGTDVDVCLSGNIAISQVCL